MKTNGMNRKIAFCFNLRVTYFIYLILFKTMFLKKSNCSLYIMIYKSQITHEAICRCIFGLKLSAHLVPFISHLKPI